MIAWEGYDANARPDGVTDPTTSLATIIHGKWDGLLTTWARALKAFGQPVLLRFLPEMNGNWNPTSEGVNGNTLGQFAEAWIHAHKIFTAVGATNVKWVWNVNVDYAGSTPLKGLYPGDAYVDYAGVDGYNWGTSQSWSIWQTPQQVFAPTLADIATFTHKPVIICETASSELGGHKATWIEQFFAYVESTPRIVGFVWFQFNKETNWLVNSSPAALAAFQAGLKGY
jgi:beta-mannanase